MTMMDEALKPCPFCGSSDVQVLDNSDIHTGEEDWLIECDNCGGAFIASNDAMPCTRSELIQRWNSRVRVEPGIKTEVLFWPKALTAGGNILSAYYGAVTMKTALQQFDIWELFYGYEIEEAWVESTDGKRYIVKHKWIAEEEGDANGNPE